MTEISVCLKERFHAAKLLISGGNVYQGGGKPGPYPTTTKRVASSVVGYGPGLPPPWPPAGLP